MGIPHSFSHPVYVLSLPMVERIALKVCFWSMVVCGVGCLVEILRGGIKVKREEVNDNKTRA